MAESGVVVQADLAVDCPHGTVGGSNKRIDLDKGCVLIAVGFPEQDEDRNERILAFSGESRLRQDLPCHLIVDSDDGVQRHAG